MALLIHGELLVFWYRTQETPYQYLYHVIHTETLLCA